MTSDETMRQAADSLQGKLVSFMETLNPNEREIMTRTMQAAADKAREVQGSDVQGYTTEAFPTIYLFYYRW
jgi:hypothetical protein